MKVPNATHRARGWAISDVASDFELLDVWALPVEGAADDFDRFLDVMTSIDPRQSGSPVARLLFRIRLRLGAWFGWDGTDARPIPGCTETTLRARLPEELRGSAEHHPGISDDMAAVAGGFRPVYRTSRDAASELSNATVHGVLHLSWVDQGDGRYRAHLAVYAKPRGVLGRSYMRAIEPFRRVVYPALLRQIGRAWRSD